MTSLRSIAGKILELATLRSTEAKRVASWDELKQHVGQPVIVTVTVIARKRQPLRMTIHRVKCSKCG